MKQAEKDSAKIRISPQKLNLILGLPRFLLETLRILFFLAIFSPSSCELPNYGKRHTGIYIYTISVKETPDAHIHILYLFFHIFSRGLRRFLNIFLFRLALSAEMFYNISGVFMRRCFENDALR